MCEGLFYDLAFTKLSQLFTFWGSGSEILFLTLLLDRVRGKEGGRGGGLKKGRPLAVVEIQLLLA